MDGGVRISREAGADLPAAVAALDPAAGFMTNAEIVCRDGVARGSAILLSFWSEVVRSHMNSLEYEQDHSLVLLAPDITVDLMNKLLKWSLKERIFLRPAEFEEAMEALSAFGVCLNFERMPLQNQGNGHSDEDEKEEEEEEEDSEEEEDVEMESDDEEADHKFPSKEAEEEEAEEEAEEEEGGNSKKDHKFASESFLFRTRGEHSSWSSQSSCEDAASRVDLQLQGFQALQDSIEQKHDLKDVKTDGGVPFHEMKESVETRSKEEQDGNEAIFEEEMEEIHPDSKTPLDEDDDKDISEERKPEAEDLDNDSGFAFDLKSPHATLGEECPLRVENLPSQSSPDGNEAKYLPYVKIKKINASEEKTVATPSVPRSASAGKSLTCVLCPRKVPRHLFLSHLIRNHYTKELFKLWKGKTDDPCPLCSMSLFGEGSKNRGRKPLKIAMHLGKDHNKLLDVASPTVKRFLEMNSLCLAQRDKDDVLVEQDYNIVNGSLEAASLSHGQEGAEGHEEDVNDQPNSEVGSRNDSRRYSVEEVVTVDLNFETDVDHHRQSESGRSHNASSEDLFGGEEDMGFNHLFEGGNSGVERGEEGGEAFVKEEDDEVKEEIKEEEEQMDVGTKEAQQLQEEMEENRKDEGDLNGEDSETEEESEDESESEDEDASEVEEEAEEDAIKENQIAVGDETMEIRSLMGSVHEQIKDFETERSQEEEEFEEGENHVPNKQGFEGKLKETHQTESSQEIQGPEVSDGVVESQPKRIRTVSHVVLFSCPTCFQTFSSNFAMNRHISDTHVENYDEESLDMERGHEPSVVEEEEDDADKAAVETPASEHSEENNDVSGTSTEVTGNSRMHQMGQRVVGKDTKGKSPRTPKNVAAKQKKTTTPRPNQFWCPCCPKQFPSNFSVRRHMSALHFKEALLELTETSGEDSTCPICDKSLGRGGRLGASRVRRLVALHVGNQHNGLERVAPPDVRERLRRMADGGGRAARDDDSELEEIPVEQEEADPASLVKDVELVELE